MGMRKSTGPWSLFVACLSMLGLVLAAGPASAEENALRAEFATQTAEADLTSAEAEQLQDEVDAYLDDFGGTQVSANRIELEGGEIVVAAPGEKYAHDLGAPATASAALECPLGYFCMYTDPNYVGNQYNLYYCGTYTLTDWVVQGSYRNNQYTGTVALLRGQSGNTVTRSVAPESDPSYDWTPIWTVVPC